MIYLTTGANGAGKTLNTLKHVREKQLSENRPVFYNGFAMRVDKAREFGWQSFDPKDWQALPDGSILILDECQNDFPVRGASAPIPEYVRALSEHRRRGFDLFMITQHPQNIDLFVRRLIGSPGWHRHLKRTFGADLVSQLEWTSVNPACEKPSSGKDGKVSMVPYPKEVYQWYDSAVIHTGKKSIPKQVYVLGICVLLVPLLIWAAVSSVISPKTLPSASSVSSSALSSLPPLPPPSQSGLTPSDYVDTFAPRVVGLAHTAPRYGDITKPTVAPYPAACIKMRDRCSCYTQQATPLATTPEICIAVVKGGYFMDWLASDSAPARPVGGLSAVSVPLPPPGVAVASVAVQGLPR